MGNLKAEELKRALRLAQAVTEEGLYAPGTTADILARAYLTVLPLVGAGMKWRRQATHCDCVTCNQLKQAIAKVAGP